MENIKFVKKSEKSIITGACQCCFPHVFEKHLTPSGKMEYSITLLVKKDDPMLADLKQMMKAALTEKFGDKLSPGWHNPLQDGDAKAEKYPEMAGFYTLKFSDAKNAPLVVDRGKSEIMNPREIYAGCWVRVQFDVYAFDYQVNGVSVKKGVGFGMRLVQKLADGEPFVRGTGPTTADDLPDLDPQEKKPAAGTIADAFGDGW